MEYLLNRYRNISTLLLVILAQLVLLAYQVKNDKDVRMIRLWTVTAVTPVARVLEFVRGGGSGFFQNYVNLHEADTENRRLRAQLDAMKMDNIFLRSQLNEAARAQALQLFQQQTQSKTIAAHVLIAGAASGSSLVLVDRGSFEGVERGMAVVTPDGIVGKIIAAYPTASQVLLITDPDFAAGVISQKSQVRGTLKGQGSLTCKMDYVSLEDKIEPGEKLYTSGDDRVFPRGFPVGTVKSVRDAQPFKEIVVEPSAKRGLEDALIILQAVHEDIPKLTNAATPVYVAPSPATAPTANGAAPQPGATPDPANPVNPATPDARPAAGAADGLRTEADRVRDKYKSIGDSQHHTFGDPKAAAAPNFNAGLPPNALKPPPAASAAPPKEAAPVPETPAAATRHKNQAAGGPGGGQN
jgi:rod shape-determining protein MreC